jgi:hypothetical protein
VTPDSPTWITARDGSIHAAWPPIIADGHAMLCGRSYDRFDLRVRVQARMGEGPKNACPACRDAVGQVAAPAIPQDAPAIARKAPLWP